MKKLLIFLGVLAVALTSFRIARADFESVAWINFGTYLETACYSGCDVLIDGLNRYLNFGSVSGTTGYGLRDTSGTIEIKNSGGNWSGMMGRVTANTAQNFGFGTTSPWGYVSIGNHQGGTEPLFVIASSSTGVATTTPFMVNWNGNVGIGTTSPASQLHVSNGPSATTTVEFGAQVVTSKTCFNVRDALGAETSFYFVGTSIVVEAKRCL